MVFKMFFNLLFLKYILRKKVIAEKISKVWVVVKKYITTTN